MVSAILNAWLGANSEAIVGAKIKLLSYTKFLFTERMNSWRGRGIESFLILSYSGVCLSDVGLTRAQPDHRFEEG